jgi:hypothetical protein
MDDAKNTPSAPRKWRLGCDTVFALLMLGIFLTYQLGLVAQRHLAQLRAAERMQQQIVELKAGKSYVIHLFTDLDMPAFVNAKNELAEIGYYQLEISYLYKVNPFLEQLSGLSTIYSLSLGKTDVSDVGLRSIVSLPNLHHLRIAGGRITDSGLTKLTACSSLETLHVNLQRDISPEVVERLRTQLPHCKITIENDCF